MRSLPRIENLDFTIDSTESLPSQKKVGETRLKRHMKHMLNSRKLGSGKIGSGKIGSDKIGSDKPSSDKHQSILKLRQGGRISSQAEAQVKQSDMVSL